MNRLEVLGNYLNSMISAETIQLEDHRPVGEAAAILLAASKVDVDELVDIAGDYGIAIGAHGAANAFGMPNTESGVLLVAARDKFETALRMALATRGHIAPAQRKWVGLTDEELLDALLNVNAGAKRLPPGLRLFARRVEVKLMEKNYG